MTTDYAALEPTSSRRARVVGFINTAGRILAYPVLALLILGTGHGAKPVYYYPVLVLYVVFACVLIALYRRKVHSLPLKNRDRRLFPAEPHSNLLLFCVLHIIGYDVGKLMVSFQVTSFWDWYGLLLIGIALYAFPHSVKVFWSLPSPPPDGDALDDGSTRESSGVPDEHPDTPSTPT